MHDLSKYGLQLQDFMKEKQIKPIANLVPVFVSFFSVNSLHNHLQVNFWSGCIS